MLGCINVPRVPPRPETVFKVLKYVLPPAELGPPAPTITSYVAPGCTATVPLPWPPPLPPLPPLPVPAPPAPIALTSTSVTHDGAVHLYIPAPALPDVVPVLSRYVICGGASEVSATNVIPPLPIVKTILPLVEPVLNCTS